jgi:hypothetical protein
MTPSLLRRKNMHLESYTCELCLLQKEEKLRHLFFKCSFVRNCWGHIGITVPTWLRADRATRYFKRRLRVPFAIEIIILMSWCIWSERSAWLFNEIDLSVHKCKASFEKEFILVMHRSKQRVVPQMKEWLETILCL